MDRLLQDVKRTRFTCRDAVDEPNDPLARQLDTHFERLELELRDDSNPYTLKEEFKRLQQTIKSAADVGVVSRGDADTIRKWAEEHERSF